MAYYLDFKHKHFLVGIQTKPNLTSSCEHVNHAEYPMQLRRLFCKEYSQLFKRYINVTLGTLCQFTDIFLVEYLESKV